MASIRCFLLLLLCTFETIFLSIDKEEEVDIFCVGLFRVFFLGESFGYVWPLPSIIQIARIGIGIRDRNKDRQETHAETLGFCDIRYWKSKRTDEPRI